MVAYLVLAAGIVLPFAMLIKNIVSEEPPAKNTFGIQKYYLNMSLYCSVGMSCAAIVLFFISKSRGQMTESVILLLSVIATLALGVLLIYMLFRRYQITLSPTEIVVTPFVGKQKRLALSEIQQLVLTPSENLHIIVNGKTAFAFDHTMVPCREIAEKCNAYFQE